MTRAPSSTTTLSHGRSASKSTSLVSFKSELFHVFDAVEREVWLLIKDSLTRYQQTATYEKMAIGKALRKHRRGTDRASGYRVSTASQRAGGGVNGFWKEIRNQLSISRPSRTTVSMQSDAKRSELKAPLLN